MIPYVRTVEYLSPSGLFLLETAPIEFYLRKLGPIESAPQGEEQGYPAAVGTAFDASIKTLLASLLGLPCPPLPALLENVKTERDRAILMGYELAIKYAYSGALSALLAEKPVGLEVHPELCMAPGTDIPLKGQLDCTVKLKGQKVPGVLDWKVTGAGRPGEASPKPGYARTFDTNNPGVAGPPHKNFGCFMEDIDERWATQLTIYNWILGAPIRERLASIDELVVGKNGRLRVAQHRAKISVPFQKQVRTRLISAWGRIQLETVVPPEMAAAGLEFCQACR